MEKLLLVLLTFLTLQSMAQQTYVPDNNFEAYLEANGMGNGITNDDYVTTANINTISTLYIDSENISDLTGIEDFDSLGFLVCSNNNLTTLDLSENLLLYHLSCPTNNLVLLDVSQNINLSVLYCALNQLTSLDLEQNVNLTQFDCSYNNLTSLNLSQNSNLISLGCIYNQLICLNVKNGSNISNNINLLATNNPNLTCIEVDDAVWSATNWTDIDPQTSFSENCNNGCSVGIEELITGTKELVKVVDLMGRETTPQKNRVLIYVYSDGTTERIFEFE